MTSNKLVKFTNCRILRNHKIIKEDFYVRNGKIINPEKVFFDEKIQADAIIDCRNNIIAPGFIELQINGGAGYDFSFSDIDKSLEVVSKLLLSHGVTSFCPTVVTSPLEVYKKVLPKLVKKKGGKHGATILGAHVEGPFLNIEKKGAHPAECLRTYKNGFKDIEEVYGSLENVKIITLAPEFPNSPNIIKDLVNKNIVVSLGHSMANLSEGEAAANNGASLLTHLFNAMLPFHHRDPGLVGLLASKKINRKIFYGIISDGVHTHPTSVRMAYRINPEGLVLVTDAISALGLEEGEHHIGQYKIEIREGKAFIAGTDTLCGSITSMDKCVRMLMEATACDKEFALEAASLHPAQALGLEKVKGSLDFGADADFVILSDDLEIISTWIAGECVYKK